MCSKSRKAIITRTNALKIKLEYVLEWKDSTACQTSHVNLYTHNTNNCRVVFIKEIYIYIYIYNTDIGKGIHLHIFIYTYICTLSISILYRRTGFITIFSAFTFQRVQGSGVSGFSGLYRFEALFYCKDL